MEIKRPSLRPPPNPKGTARNPAAQSNERTPQVPQPEGPTTDAGSKPASGAGGQTGGGGTTTGPFRIGDTDASVSASTDALIGSPASELGLPSYTPDPVTIGLNLPKVVPVIWIDVGGAAIMKEALSYAIAQGLGRWSPRTRFVELFLDGKYQGLYLLIEKVRRDRDRLPLPKVAATAAEGDITGGFTFHHEGAGNGGINDFSATSKLKYTYDYPKADEITPEQTAYLKAAVNKMEAALKPTADFANVIDVASWVDYTVMQEVANNWDGYARSVHFAKLPSALGGRVMVRPLWDFDLAFGNGGVNYIVAGVVRTNYSCRTDNWSYKNGRPGVDGVPPYWPRLQADPSFQAALKCRWTEVRKGTLSSASFDTRIATWTAFTASARRRD